MRYLIIITVLLISNLTFSQEKVEFKKIYLSESGKLISEKFAKTIDLDIGNSKSTFNKSQAKVVLNKFFTNRSFVNYKANHNGGGNGRPFFEIGELSTENSLYRTYILYNIVDNEIEIIELRIEEE